MCKSKTGYFYEYLNAIFCFFFFSYLNLKKDCVKISSNSVVRLLIIHSISDVEKEEILDWLRGLSFQKASSRFSQNHRTHARLDENKVKTSSNTIVFLLYKQCLINIYAIYKQA